MGIETTAYIGLGSNMGDRCQALAAAVNQLRSLDRTRLTALSSVYETSPVGLEGDLFLNAVAVIETGLPPRELMVRLLEVERRMGRVRSPGKTGSRPMDLDLLVYGTLVMEEEELTLPHPRMLQRRFVMEPLAEVAPDLSIPPDRITASVAAADLARRHPEQEIRRLGKLQGIKLRFEV